MKSNPISTFGVIDMNLNSISITKRKWACDCCFNLEVLEARKLSQRSGYKLTFCAKLLVISDMLPAATAATFLEMNTRGLNAMMARLYNFDQFGFDEIFLDRGDFDFNVFSRSDQIDENNDSIFAADTAAADRQAIDMKFKPIARMQASRQRPFS